MEKIEEGSASKFLDVPPAASGDGVRSRAESGASDLGGWRRSSGRVGGEPGHWSRQRYADIIGLSLNPHGEYRFHGKSRKDVHIRRSHRLGEGIGKKETHLDRGFSLSNCVISSYACKQSNFKMKLKYVQK